MIAGGLRKALLELTAGELSLKTLPVGVKFAAPRANFMTTGTLYSF